MDDITVIDISAGTFECILCLSEYGKSEMASQNHCNKKIPEHVLCKTCYNATKHSYENFDMCFGCNEKRPVMKQLAANNNDNRNTVIIRVRNP